MKSKWINEIKGYEECGVGYKIFENGDVVSYKNGNVIENAPQRTLKTQVSKGTRGYAQVQLGNRTVKIHRLVALVFIPNPENKPQVNHIDGNKTNNCVSNLEWCDNSENQKHAFKYGLHKSKKGDESPYWENEEAMWTMNKRRMVIAYDKDMNVIGEYKSAGDASRKLGICLSTIIRGMNDRHLCKKKYYFKEILREK